MNSKFWIIMSTHTATGIWVRETGGNCTGKRCRCRAAGEKVQTPVITGFLPVFCGTRGVYWLSVPLLLQDFSWFLSAGFCT